MSTSGYAARVGAAAFVLGIAMGSPLAAPAPAAYADAGETSVTGDTGRTARTAREPKATNRADNSGRSSTPRAAAAGDPADNPSDSPVHRHRAASPQSSADAEPAVAPVAAEPAVRPRPSRSVTTPVNAPVPVPVAETVVQAPSPQAPTAAAVGVPAAPSASAAPPMALASASTPAAAATSPLTGGLFGSFRGLFEGAALMWRRRFFNEAPSVSPVQLTGLIEGPITGTIGATDPEDDPLVYTVTGDPRYGSVTVSQDGSYTYTPGTDFAGSDNFIVAVTDTGKHINLLDLRRPKSTDASVSVAQGEQAPLLRFQFVYGSGSKFWSSEARAALETAATQLAGYLVVSTPVTITYAVTGQSSPLASTLASAGSDFVDGTGFMQTVVQKKIQTGVDSNGSTADGEITWNFGPSWGYGDTVSNTQYDFQSTALHELLHTLGFMSYIDKAANNTGQTWTIFDNYVVNSAGNAVIGTDFNWNTDYNANLTGGNGGLYFGGANAVAAYGGPVPLYTPFPYESGSSMSHLDDDSFTGKNEKLMNAVSGQGKGVRVISPVELGILADIGYQLAPSGTPTLMIVGFFFIRRPRRKSDDG